MAIDRFDPLLIEENSLRVGFHDLLDCRILSNLFEDGLKLFLCYKVWCLRLKRRTFARHKVYEWLRYKDLTNLLEYGHMVTHITCCLLEQDQSFFAIFEIVSNHSHGLLLKGLLSDLDSGFLQVHLDTVVNKSYCIDNDIR